MVARKTLIAPEIAARYGAALSTVQRQWKVHPEWPSAVGKRGRWSAYDAGEVEAAVERLFRRPGLPDTGRPNDELTVADIAAYTGLAEATVRADISRGRIPQHDAERHGVKYWHRSTIDAAMKDRRPYRRQT